MSDDGAKANAARDITFGSIAGMISKVFEHPFDLVKVRLQSQPGDAPASFSGPLDCFKQTYGKEGWRGLYRGLSMPVIGAMAENATLFLVYNKCQDAIVAASSSSPGVSEKVLGKRRELSTPELALAAGAAGACASFILTPIELIKCRMQVQMLVREAGMSASTGGPASSARTLGTVAPPEGPLSLIFSTLRTQGIRGLWLGQLGTLFRETGGSAAWFTTYELVSGWFLSRRQAMVATPLVKSDLPTWQLMASGAAAGAAYNVILFPADSVKSSIQTWAELHPDKPRLGFLAMGQKIWKTKGIKGLYAGCGMTVLRSAPSSAMIFFIYETLQGRFGRYFD
ncbi:mitochondrial carrier domain-containing protein [Kockovaella imperatae]|uniref:Mitochondrial carrier domain-containing protein n=1 Tax=Kockovaella imperatae TaxID=4999 RepID=A0A1Y1U7I3_9TREE|nr:mitochondrial carrier domain-containing protein [Kockovaella imperatae]ORX33972.1 mitochondrial carrier domain-containing protein [Kockovaella imperatae]